MNAPLFYTFNAADRIAEVTYHQQPTIEQWEHTMSEVLTKLGPAQPWDVLLDRGALHIAADTDYIRRMTAFMDRHKPAEHSRRWAIIVADPASYSMGLLAEQLTLTPGSIRVFYLRNEGLTWLRAGR